MTEADMEIITAIIEKLQEFRKGGAVSIYFDCLLDYPGAEIEDDITLRQALQLLDKRR